VITLPAAPLDPRDSSWDQLVEAVAEAARARRAKNATIVRAWLKQVEVHAGLLADVDEPTLCRVMQGCGSVRHPAPSPQQMSSFQIAKREGQFDREQETAPERA